MLLFSIYSILMLEKAHYQMAVQRLQRQAHNMALRMDERLAISASALNSLAETDAVRNNDLHSLYQSAARVVKRNPHFTAVTLVDEGGAVLFVTSQPYGSKNFSARHPELVNRVFETGMPNVSGPFQVPFSPHWLTAVSVPVYRNGKVVYCLRMILRVDSINRILADGTIPSNWIAAIVDRNGVLVARNQQPEKFVGKLARPEFLERLKQADQQVFQTVTLEGIPTTTVLLPIYGGDWNLAIGVPNESLIGPLNHRVQKIIAFAAVWLALSFALSQFMSRYLIKQMSAVTRAVAHGSEQGLGGQRIRVTEFWAIFRSLLQAKAQEAVVRSDLREVSLQRDEVRDLYDHAPCGYHSLDLRGHIVQINQTELHWMGRSKEEVLGRPLTDFLSLNDSPAFAEYFAEFLAKGEVRDKEYRLVHKDGSIRSILVSSTAVRDWSGQIVRTRSTMFDITERKKLEERLDRIARVDMLTDLSNRRDFYEHAGPELARSKKMGLPLSLMMIDIDHFKQFNDTHGHAGGDEVLRVLGQTCKRLLRPTDLPARLGGEEFAVLLPETAEDEAMEMAQRLRVGLAGLRVRLSDGNTVSFTVSIGISSLAESDADIDDVLRRADTALYDAKRNGRNQVRHTPRPHRYSHREPEPIKPEPKQPAEPHAAIETSVQASLW